MQYIILLIIYWKSNKLPALHPSDVMNRPVVEKIMVLAVIFYIL